MSWAISISTWMEMEYLSINRCGGKLSRSIQFPDQWRWRDNIVFANTKEEANAKFVQQFRPKSDYWERIGHGNFMWVVGGYRGAIYRHRSDKTLWKFKDFAFHAETETNAYEFLFERFGKRETA